jgi:ABC-2 type transport system ATP-binding protein
VTAALQTSGLGKRYRRTWALQDCYLTVHQGRIAALVGPNGAGKTTLLHLAVGLLAPTTGTIRVLDQPPATPSCSPGSASSPRTPPCTATSPPPST